MACPIGLTVAQEIKFPLVCSFKTVKAPSPPSEIGRHFILRSLFTLLKPFSMAEATSMAERLSLKESGTMSSCILLM